MYVGELLVGIVMGMVLWGVWRQNMSVADVDRMLMLLLGVELKVEVDALRDV